MFSSPVEGHCFINPSQLPVTVGVRSTLNLTLGSSSKELQASSDFVSVPQFS